MWFGFKLRTSVIGLAFLSHFQMHLYNLGKPEQVCDDGWTRKWTYRNTSQVDWCHRLVAALHCTVSAAAADRPFCLFTLCHCRDPPQIRQQQVQHLCKEWYSLLHQVWHWSRQWFPQHWHCHGEQSSLSPTHIFVSVYSVQCVCASGASLQSSICSV